MSQDESKNWPEPSKNAVAIKNMFSSVALKYDLANRVMSLGRDPFWRSALAKRVKVLKAPGRLLDLAAGTGDQIVAIKNLHPLMEAVGVDLSVPMMDLAEPKFDRLPLPRPEMVAGDALDLPFGENSFDSVSISFGLRNIPDRVALYGQAHRVLKPGGRFLVLEMFHDRDHFLAPVVRAYLKVVAPRLGGCLISREREAYRYLASSILAFPQPAQLALEMSAAGFTNLNYKTYTFNTVMLVWGEKPQGLQGDL